MQKLSHRWLVTCISYCNNSGRRSTSCLPGCTGYGLYEAQAGIKVQFSSVQSLSHVQLFATPWTIARQASLSITDSWSLLKLTSIELVMPSNHLVLCRPLLLLPSVFSSIRVFSNESVLRIRWPKYGSFSFNISINSSALSFLYDPILTSVHDYWRNHSFD